LLAAPVLLSHSGGAPTRKTGAPRFGEQDCTRCHAGTADSGTGKIHLTGIPERYTPGQVYNVRVSLEQSAQKSWGFELAARTKSGTQAGKLMTGDDGFTQVKTDKEVQFMTHTSKGMRAGTINGPVNFDFFWRAPDEDVGAVYFDVAGNAANNNDSNKGDFIYTLEKSSVAAGGSRLEKSNVATGGIRPQISRAGNP
jgi:hypothetical protein